jgi:hypothetical protein
MGEMSYAQTAQIGFPWNVAHIIERGIEGTNSGSKEIRGTLCPVWLTSAVVLSPGGGKDGLSGNDFGDISYSSFGKSF